MPKNDLIELLQKQDFFLINNKEEFIENFPKPVYGKYIPQPYSEPLEYPCMVQSMYVIPNSNGADYLILSFIYLGD